MPITILQLTPKEEKLKKLTFVIYGLYALWFAMGITAIAGLMMNFIKRDEVKGTLLESHFRWQMRTFWYGVAWGFFGLLTTVIGIGIIILYADAFWIVYRIVKGALDLYDDKPMYDSAQTFPPSDP